MRTKTTKRIISLLVIIGLLIAMIPMMQMEETFASEYNITAKINNGLEMGGASLSEIISNYATENARITSISILGGVVSTDDWQTIRQHIEELSSLEIQNTVLSVAEIPTNLVGATAQKPNTRLQTINLSQATDIPASTFANCTGLIDVSLPNVAKIGAKSFSNCISLQSISLGINPPAIANDSFSACPIDRIAYIPANAVNSYVPVQQIRSASDENSYYGQWNGFMLMDVTEKVQVFSNRATVTATDKIVTISSANLTVVSPVALKPMIDAKQTTATDTYQVTDTTWKIGTQVCDKNNELFKGATIYDAVITLKAAEDKIDTIKITDPNDPTKQIDAQQTTKYLFDLANLNTLIKDQFNPTHVTSKTVAVSSDGKTATILLSFAETAETSDDSTKATVNITVEDNNGNPINGAFIELVDVDGTSRKLTSDSKGQGVFYDVPLGSYTVNLSAKGHKRENYVLVVPDGGVSKRYQMQTYGIKSVKVTASANSVYKGEAIVFEAQVEGQAGSSVTQAVTWSIEGNKHSDTRITKDGTLYVSSEETAASIKVIATADDGVTTGSATARVQNPPNATDIKKVDLVITPPKTGEVPQEKLREAREYVGELEWSPAITQEGGVFLPEKKYIAKVTLTANVGYKFPQNVEPTVKDAKIRNLKVNKDEAKNILTFEVVFNVTVDPSKKEQAPLVFKNSFPASRYGDSDYSLVISGGSGDGKFTYESTNEKVLKVVATNTKPVVQVVGAGTAKIKVTKEGTADTETEKGYQPAFLESPELTVKKAVLTATAKDKAIHENESTTFEVKVTGFKKSDNPDRLEGYKEPTASAKDTTIGVHPIVVSGGEPTANYEFKYVDGKLRVVAEGEKLPSSSDDDSGDTADGDTDKLVSDSSGSEVTVEIIDGDLFEDGTKLVVKDVTKTLDERDLKVYQKNITSATGKTLIQMFEISLEKDGESIQPDGKVKVTIRMADTVRQNYRDIGAIYADDGTGKIEVLDSSVYYDKISFNTDHFSLYGLIGTAKTSTTNPQTGDKAFNYGFVLVGLVALAILIFVPKRKKIK